VTVKTAVSRFQIHDELTAPDESAPLIKSIQAAGGAVTKFVGVLAGAPAVLRAYTRMRSELRGGVLPQATRERIALAVAEHREDDYSIAQHAKAARRAGLGLDEVSKARSFTSGDEKEPARNTATSGAVAAPIAARRPAPGSDARRRVRESSRAHRRWKKCSGRAICVPGSYHKEPVRSSVRLEPHRAGRREVTSARPERHTPPEPPTSQPRPAPPPPSGAATRAAPPPTAPPPPARTSPGSTGKRRAP
jgi:AhpD family alkylhydroperoxidase